VEKNYYFVLEPGGTDDGPYVLTEIRRRLSVGLISQAASLCRVGEMEGLPLTHERFAEVLRTPPRTASGTTPPTTFIDVPVVPLHGAPPPPLRLPLPAPAEPMPPAYVPSAPQIEPPAMALQVFEPRPAPIPARKLSRRHVWVLVGSGAGVIAASAIALIASR
jgi:hypothetical protein